MTLVFLWGIPIMHMYTYMTGISNIYTLLWSKRDSIGMSQYNISFWVDSIGFTFNLFQLRDHFIRTLVIYLYSSFDTVKVDIE